MIKIGRKTGLVALMVSAVMSVSAQTHKDSTNLKKTQQLEEVVINGSQVKRINGSAYNVVAVDASQLRNTNLDIAGMLDRVSGVKIRQDGGLGSAASINLNGFTGKHIRLFIDGVPMSQAATSLGINNIPAGIAQRIEVYKGVVPVEYGGDALGGAINIVTDRRTGTYLDASYSYGSFNTHRTNIALGTSTAKGLVFKLNAWQNYSDNDYRVKVQNTNLETMQVDAEATWHKRFHNTYHNEAAMLQVGLEGKSWADRLMVGFTWSNEYQEIQNANLMKVVFGGKLRKNYTLSPTLSYDKRNLFLPGLHLKINARYDVSLTNNIDTVSRTYNWQGNYIARTYQGEGVATLAEFRGKTLSTVAALTYHLGHQHFFSLNDTYTNYHRITTDDAANATQASASTYMRRINNKNIVALSYKLVPNDRYNILAFLKYYSSHISGPVKITSREYEEQTRSTDDMGYGMAATWIVSHDWQLKASYERTSRLPTDRELFGDGDYEDGNATLKPERSHNVNLNLGWQHTLGYDHTLMADVAINYRDISDYIIRTISANGTAVSTNHGKVTGLGADFSFRYFFRDVLAVGGNYSLQRMCDRERYTDIGAISITYGDRVPNTPYAFGNADAQYTFKNVMGRGNRLTIGYNLRYIHRFYRYWQSSGTNLTIPEQLSHDASITYSFGSHYHVAFEANNFTDELLYDNYSLQKPGRNFNIKFRYTLFTQRK